MTDHSATTREAISFVSEGGGCVRFHVKPDVIFGNLQRELQRSLDLAALAFQGVGEQAEALPEIPAFPRIQLASRLSPTELHELYRSWVIGHAITDLVEALEPFLSDVARMCRVAVLQGQGTMERDQLRRTLEAPDLEVPLGQKLNVLAHELPPLVTGDLVNALKSLNKLRVCLTHARGQVRDKDCNVPGSLELSQVFWEFWVQYESGREERVTAGMVTEEPGMLFMRRSRTPKRFNVGEQVKVDLADLAIIASTVFELSLVLRKELYKFLREKEFFPKDFREPDRRLTLGAAFEMAQEATAASPESTVVEHREQPTEGD